MRLVSATFLSSLACLLIQIVADAATGQGADARTDCRTRPRDQKTADKTDFAYGNASCQEPLVEDCG